MSTFDLKHDHYWGNCVWCGDRLVRSIWIMPFSPDSIVFIVRTCVTCDAAVQVEDEPFAD